MDAILRFRLELGFLKVASPRRRLKVVFVKFRAAALKHKMIRLEHLLISIKRWNWIFQIQSNFLHICMDRLHRNLLLLCLTWLEHFQIQLIVKLWLTQEFSVYSGTTSDENEEYLTSISWQWNQSMISLKTFKKERKVWIM